MWWVAESGSLNQRARNRKIFQGTSKKEMGKGLRWKPKHEVDLRSSGAEGPEATGADNVAPGQLSDMAVTEAKVDQHENDNAE